MLLSVVRTASVLIAASWRVTQAVSYHQSQALSVLALVLERKREVTVDLGTSSVAMGEQLCDASRCGQLSKVASLLRRGVSVNSRDPHSWVTCCCGAVCLPFVLSTCIVRSELMATEFVRARRAPCLRLAWRSISHCHTPSLSLHAPSSTRQPDHTRSISGHLCTVRAAAGTAMLWRICLKLAQTCMRRTTCVLCCYVASCLKRERERR